MTPDLIEDCVYSSRCLRIGRRKLSDAKSNVCFRGRLLSVDMLLLQLSGGSDWFLSVPINPQVCLFFCSFRPVLPSDGGDAVEQGTPGGRLVATVTCLRCRSRTDFLFPDETRTNAFGVYVIKRCRIKHRFVFSNLQWSFAEKNSVCVSASC